MLSILGGLKIKRYLLLIVFLLSLTIVIATPSLSITSCGVLNQSNTTYYLENNVNTSETCFIISANNITLDCQGHNITGLETEDTYGIYVEGNYSEIKNCSVNEFYMGLYLYQSSNNILTNINSYDNGHKYRNLYDERGGLYLYYSDNNNLTDINSHDNERYGLYFSGSNNILTNINSYNNIYNGLYLYISHNNTISNMNSYNNSNGFEIWGSNNIFSNINSYDNINYGFHLYGYKNNIMRNVAIWGNNHNFNAGDPDNDIDISNTVDGKPIHYLKNAKNQVFDSSTNAGIFYCYSCDNITIKNLNFTNNDYGIRLWNTTNSQIVNISSYNNSDGLYILYSNNNILTNINSHNNVGSGLFLYRSNNNTLTNINSYNNYNRGLYLDEFNNNTLRNINSYNSNFYGFQISNSNNNILFNVSSYNNGRDGLYFQNFRNNILTNIDSYNNGDDGLYFQNFRNNILTNIDSYNNDWGLYSYPSSAYNNILNNINSYNNQYGLQLSGLNNTMRNNTLSNNTYNFFFDTSPALYSDIDTTNTVDGKPVYYMKNAKNQIFDDSTNAGLFYCFSCDNITVKDLNLTKNKVGIFFWNTINSKIENINSYNNKQGGLYIYNSNNNIFTNIDSYNNFLGIDIDESNNNTLSNINSYNNNGGLSLYNSNNNTLTNINSYNHFDSYGFHFQGSGSNTLSNVNSYNNSYGLMFYTNSPDNEIEYSNIYSNTNNNLNNDQPYEINAEYNYWGYTTAEEIDAKINDDNENPSFGEVDFIPWLNNPGSNFEEKYRSETNLNENVLYQNAGLNATISGDMEGTINFSDFDIVEIETGAFANKGFSRGHWKASLDNYSYEGVWKGFLLHDLTERKIYLKGSTSGYFKGTVEGYLEESVNGSNIYDKYYATWKIVKDDSSAILEMSGTLAYKEPSESQTKLHMLQTSVNGHIIGDYYNNLDIILTYLRIDEENPFYGEGFSIISYTSDLGSGQGWVYASYSTLPKITELSGMFTSPLYGVVQGMLDESESPLKLFIGVDRVDLGLPPMADLEVRVWGPERVSPGQTVDYVIEYRNNGLMGAEDVVLVYKLSNLTQYISSSNGIYVWQTNEILWKLGTLPPRSKGYLSVKVGFIWGVPQHTQSRSVVEIGTSSEEKDVYLNPESAIYNLQDYIDYEDVDVVLIENLTYEEFEYELTDPNFLDLYDYSKELGFVYTNVTLKVLMSDNTSLVLSLMTLPEEPSRVVLVTKKISPKKENLPLITELNETHVSFFDRNGGMIYDKNNDVSGWGEWNETHSLKRVQCVANCISLKFPSLLSGLGYLKKLGNVIGAIYSSIDCTNCFSTGNPSACKGCQATILVELTKRFGSEELAERLGHVLAVMAMVDCVDNCTKNPDSYLCVHCTYLHWCVPFANGGWKIHCLYGGYVEMPELFFCGNDEICRHGRGCQPKDEVPNSDTHDSGVRGAHDPNIKYGPEGNVLPSQTLNYTVEYENEGEGIAFGVYFTDTLDENLDDSTLEIGPVISTVNDSVIAPLGIYNPETRTITWFVGEVGPKEGGYANFNVSVKSNATIGTEIINFAIVYFPSVPEVTKTNGIISFVNVPDNISISLLEGWNLISIPLNLSNNSINYIFNNTSLTIYSYKNNSWFVSNEIDNKLGYWIKINESENITLIGSEIENKTISLNGGWNLIGYPYLYEIDVNNFDLRNYTIFAYINNSWSSYVSGRTVNSLESLEPGYGYWVNVE